MSGYVQVACNQRGRNASQLNIGGTSLGSFNDRFRDALMGGSPFASPRYQGYVTGLHTQSNSFTQVNIAALCLSRVMHPILSHIMSGACSGFLPCAQDQIQQCVRSPYHERY